MTGPGKGREKTVAKVYSTASRRKAAYRPSQLSHKSLLTAPPSANNRTALSKQAPSVDRQKPPTPKHTSSRPPAAASTFWWRNLLEVLIRRSRLSVMF